MAIAEREATVVWSGDLAEGSGEIHHKSSSLEGMPFSWKARTEKGDENTSPEEMIAAAHAGCYAMALSHTLADGGNTPNRLEVSARVTLDEEGDGGAFKITHSDLAVVAQVEGLEPEEFDEIARAAERGCPVSNALRASVQIALVPQLEGHDPIEPGGPPEEDEDAEGTSDDTSDATPDDAGDEDEVRVASAEESADDDESIRKEGDETKGTGAPGRKGDSDVAVDPDRDDEGGEGSGLSGGGAGTGARGGAEFNT